MNDYSPGDQASAGTFFSSPGLPHRVCGPLSLLISWSSEL